MQAAVKYASHFTGRLPGTGENKPFIWKLHGIEVSQVLFQVAQCGLI